MTRPYWTMLPKILFASLLAVPVPASAGSLTYPGSECTYYSGTQSEDAFLRPYGGLEMIHNIDSSARKAVCPVISTDSMVQSWTAFVDSAAWLSTSCNIYATSRNGAAAAYPTSSVTLRPIGTGTQVYESHAAFDAGDSTVFVLFCTMPPGSALMHYTVIQ